MGIPIPLIEELRRRRKYPTCRSATPPTTAAAAPWACGRGTRLKSQAAACDASYSVVVAAVIMVEWARDRKRQRETGDYGRGISGGERSSVAW